MARCGEYEMNLGFQLQVIVPPMHFHYYRQNASFQLVAARVEQAVIEAVRRPVYFPISVKALSVDPAFLAFTIRAGLTPRFGE